MKISAPVVFLGSLSGEASAIAIDAEYPVWKVLLKRSKRDMSNVWGGNTLL